MGSPRHLPLGCVAACVVGLRVGVGFAADPPPTEAAAEAFREGKRAAEAGEYAAAARAFARADAMAPNDVALDAALKATVLADDASLGMELVERARRGSETQSMASVEQARTRFIDRVGKLRVDCARCGAVLDGSPVTVNVVLWVGIGNHHVDLTEGARAVRVPIKVAATTETVARMPPPAPGDAAVGKPVAEGFRGISPAFFFIGLGLTVASGAGLVASAVDVKSKHDAFETAPSKELKSAGEAATVRTNALIGVTAGLGAITTVLAIVTDWKSLTASRTTKKADAWFDLSDVDGGAIAGVAGRF